MGNSCSICQTQGPYQQIGFDTKSLVVGTLNYGGILKSPFQFYSDQQDQQKKLSQCFYNLLKIYIKDFNPKDFQWKIGKIDHKIQQQRYSPLYSKQVGIDKKQKRLVAQQEFEEKWDLYYQLATKQIKVQPEPSKKQIQNMKLFDLIAYHAILQYVYNLNSKSKLAKINVFKLNYLQYAEFMNKKFSKSYLNEDQKIQKIKKVIFNFDVVFFQQPTQKLIQTLHKYQNLYVKDHGVESSMIVIKKNKFMNYGKFKLNQIQQLQKQQHYLNFNGNQDATVLSVGKFIFVSAHLSSKQQKNTAEVIALKDVLNKMQQDFKQYKIILGSDTNSFVNHGGIQNYNIFPHFDNFVTSSKKRTYLQPQFKKANKEVKTCKDHIITQKPIKTGIVGTIDGRRAEVNTLLPLDNHPFDHFMVICHIQE